MRIGVDFDNTIVSYDRLFTTCAGERGWLPPGAAGWGKRRVRDAVRGLPEGELKWQQLQAQVYGARMGEAEPVPGVVAFLQACRRRGLPLVIISHKTRYARRDPGGVDLRRAALGWLGEHGFLDAAGLGFQRHEIFFESTREEKIQRIRQQGCSHFIDDLEELFREPGFPREVAALLLHDPEGGALAPGPFIPFRDWRGITRHLLGEGPRGEALKTLAERLTGGAVEGLAPVAGGANNRLYRVTTRDGGEYALKLYPAPTGDDPRDRWGVEQRALGFLGHHRVALAPRLLAAEAESRAALLEWVAGEGIGKPGAAELEQVVDVVGMLQELSREPGAQWLPWASEACRSGADLEAQVEGRIQRLQGVAAGHPGLQRFLSSRLLPWWRERRERGRAAYGRLGIDFAGLCPPEVRTLSPADFGFHNTLREASGRLRFLDLEYFGWDDPVKLVAEFPLHPAMELEPAWQGAWMQRLTERFGGVWSFRARLAALGPLLAARWALIVLNPFLPAWRVGRMAPDAALLARRLARAESLLVRGERLW